MAEKAESKKPKKDKNPTTSTTESSADVKIKHVEIKPQKLLDYKVGKVKYDYDPSNIVPVPLSSSSSSESESDEEEIEWETEQLELAKESVVPEADPFPPKLSVPPVMKAEVPAELVRFNPMWALIDRDPANRKEILPDKLMVFYGKRGTGKTFAMRQMCWHMRHYIPAGFVMTNTPFNGYWQQYFPEKAVLEGFNIQKLYAHLAAKAKFIKKWNKTPWMQKTINPYTLIVLEDCVNALNINHSEAIRAIALNGRHLKICCMISTQYTKAVGPVIRGQTDFAFVLFQELFTDKEAVIENYMSALMARYSKTSLMEWIDSVTQSDEENGRRGVLVIDNQRQTIEMDKKLFIAQFVDPGPFKFGSEEWRRELN